MQNCGRAKLAGTESTTIGGPRKFTMCIAENFEALSKRKPEWVRRCSFLILHTHAHTHTHTQKPFRGDGKDVVTAKSMSSGVDQLVDFKMDRSQFLDQLGAKIANLWLHAPCFLSECTVVISPEHYYMLHDSGIKSKDQLASLLFDAANARAAMELGNAASILTMNKMGPIKRMIVIFAAHVLRVFIWTLQQMSPPQGHTILSRLFVAFGSLCLIRVSPRYGTTLVCLMILLGYTSLLRKTTRKMCALAPKVARESSIHILVCGSEAGKFSCVMPGFGAETSAAMKISRCVTREIRPQPKDFESNVKIQQRALSSDCTRLVDPRGNCSMSKLIPASRLSNSKERVVGLMDISKPGGSWFLDRVGKLLVARGEAREVRRYAKPTFSRPCPDALRRTIASECDVVILGLAD